MIGEEDWSRYERDGSAIGSWIEACFPGDSPMSKIGIEELIAEAAEAARNDFGVDSANEWANGYTFPPDLLASDVRCLRAAQLDFRSMVERRLKILSKDRLSRTRVTSLSPDNPELSLMEDLADGMRVATPEGFAPNGHQPRSPLRASYDGVGRRKQDARGGDRATLSVHFAIGSCSGPCP